MATYRSNLTAVQAALRTGVRNGLLAGAQILVNAVKLGLRGGYTTGDFVTGMSINHVTRSPVVMTGAFDGYIKVGTSLDYNLFWELGHYNLFTRRFERVRVWEPAAWAQEAAIKLAFAAQVERALAGVGKAR